MVNKVVVIILTNTSVRVSWERLLISEITQYLVSYQLMENQKRQATNGVVVVPSTESSVEIAGLITGAEYLFQMAAQAEVEGEIIVGHMSELTVATLTNFTRPVTVAPLTKPNSIGEGLNMLYCVYIAWNKERVLTYMSTIFAEYQVQVAEHKLIV